MKTLITKIIGAATGIIFTACLPSQPVVPGNTKEETNPDGNYPDNPDSDNQDSNQGDNGNMDNSNNGNEEYDNYAERGDLEVTIDTDTYQKGSRFFYRGKIQNAREEDIYIDSEKGNLEWRLVKQGKVFYTEKITDNFSIRLKEFGYFEMWYEDGKFNVRTENSDITYDGKTYKVRYFPLVKSMDANCYTFEQAGIYNVDFLFTYNYEDEWYRSKFTSEEFVVVE